MRILPVLAALLLMGGATVLAQEDTAREAPSLSPEKTSYVQRLTPAMGAGYAQGYESRLLEFEGEKQHMDVVFLGDSLTNRGDWQRLSGKLSIANRGIDGDTIAGLEVRLDQVAAMRPRALFLLIGVNDLSTRWRPDVYKDYAALLDDLKEQLPDTQIYVQSLLPTRDDMRVIMDNSVIVLVNNKIRAMAEERGMAYIDIFSGLLDPAENRLKREYTMDGLHLTPAGYAVWEQALAPYLGQLEGLKAQEEQND